MAPSPREPKGQTMLEREDAFTGNHSHKRTHTGRMASQLQGPVRNLWQSHVSPIMESVTHIHNGQDRETTYMSIDG